MTGITSLTGVEIAQLVKSRQMSAREIAEAFLGRISELNPIVNAI
jgi:Asp-tRNA(Asn)/Glu-tRNA(Gln) amidotransferase A subunit family amidase